MALESFYGGKQGVSPVIKAKFKYINTEDPAYKARYNIATQESYTTKLTKEEARWLNDVFNTDTYKAGNDHPWTPETLKPFTMNECLKDVHYTDVWYGELCIIDTDNKLNPYNGMLFKRTLKQYDNRFAGTEYTLYAEYIGQIVGPSGGIPNFDFGSLNTEKQKAIGELATAKTDVVPLDNTNWDYSYPTGDGTLTTNNPGKDKDQIATLSAGNPDIEGTNSANIQMVSGKNHDTIKYTWCNVRRRIDGKDDDAWVYLGFEIPYSWFDIEDTEIPYWEICPNLLDHTFSNDRPFYHNLHFYIPRGARGIGPEYITVIREGQTLPGELYDKDSIKYSFEGVEADQNGGDAIPEDNYYIPKGTAEYTPTEKSYWIAKWTLYNPKTGSIKPKEVYQYLGSYKDIASIDLKTDGGNNLNGSGTITINYSDGSHVDFDRALNWITNITLDVNQNSNNFGKFTINFNNQKKIQKKDWTIPLIKNITYTDSTGKIIANYAGVNEDKEVGTIEYIKNWSVDDNSGKLTGTSNISSNGELEDVSTYLHWPESINYNDSNGEITINYITGEENGSLVTTPMIADGQITHIKEIRIENGILKYNTNTSPNNWSTVTDGAGNAIHFNSVEDVAINSRGELLIYYSDPEKRPNPGDTYDEKTGWENLGSITIKPTILKMRYKDSTGNIVNDYDAASTALESLNNGYTDPNISNTYAQSDGTLFVKGEDSSGWFVSFSVKENGQEEGETHLAYYNPVANNGNGAWVDAGVIGGASSGGSATNISSINPEYNSQDPESKQYLVWDNNTEVTFKYDGNMDSNVKSLMKFPWETNF